MGFRDRAEAARARIAVLEQDVAALRRENAELRRRLAKQDTPPIPVPAAKQAAPIHPDVRKLVARAYKPVIVLWAATAAIILLCWAGHFELLPQAMAGATPYAALVLGLVWLVSVFLSLWWGARPIREGSGYDNTMMIFVIWFWLPFALLMPVVGQVMALTRVVVLFRGKLAGGTITSTSGGSRTIRSYDAARLSHREGWPAAVAYLCLAVGLPAIIISVAGTNLGSRSFETVRFKGRITAVSGTIPAQLEQACIVRVEPHTGLHNCRILVQCDGLTLYGGGTMGYTHCEVDNGVPVYALDSRDTAQEGDPRLTFDLSRHQVVVSDDAPQRYKITVSLDPVR